MEALRASSGGGEQWSAGGSQKRAATTNALSLLTMDVLHIGAIPLPPALAEEHPPFAPQPFAIGGAGGFPPPPPPLPRVSSTMSRMGVLHEGMPSGFDPAALFGSSVPLDMSRGFAPGAGDGSMMLGSLPTSMSAGFGRRGEGRISGGTAALAALRTELPFRQPAPPEVNERTVKRRVQQPAEGSGFDAGAMDAAMGAAMSTDFADSLEGLLADMPDGGLMFGATSSSLLPGIADFPGLPSAQALGLSGPAGHGLLGEPPSAGGYGMFGSFASGLGGGAPDFGGAPRGPPAAQRAESAEDRSGRLGDGAGAGFRQQQPAPGGSNASGLLTAAFRAPVPLSAEFSCEGGASAPGMSSRPGGGSDDRSTPPSDATPDTSSCGGLNAWNLGAPAGMDVSEHPEADQGEVGTAVGSREARESATGGSHFCHACGSRLARMNASFCSLCGEKQ